MLATAKTTSPKTQKCLKPHGTSGFRHYSPNRHCIKDGVNIDPAAGSGNFLTESYLSLRRLENDILRETVTDSAGTGLLGFVEEEFNPIQVSIEQFYGIEINDFAVAVARTAMWIAESQMFAETADIVQREMDFLPLRNNTNLYEGNALRMDWRTIVPSGGGRGNIHYGKSAFCGVYLSNRRTKRRCSQYLEG